MPALGAIVPLTRTDLTTWTLRAATETPVHVPLDGVPATVPGCVHTDLLAAGIIADPYQDDHEHLQHWIGRTDWSYSTTFDHVSPDQNTDDQGGRVELVFAGVDTVAQIMLNGREIGRTQNMHRTYRFDITEAQVPGTNALLVNFTAPSAEAVIRSEQLGPRPHVEAHPFNALRKMACSFGWDWGPDTATSGLWKPVSIESWSVARLDGVRCETSVQASKQDADAGAVTVHADVATASEASGLEVLVRVSGPGLADPIEARGSVKAGSASVRVEVPKVQRWWPAGHGDQPLYDVDVTLVRGDDDSADPLDSAQRRVGFRTVRWETGADEIGMPFTLVVNERPIVVKGANWIPDDCFPHRVTRERIADRFDAAQFAGVNLIRVWGGGIYESNDFYDLADERGLLTWQDFLLACAFYNDDDPLRSEIAAEARDNVTRIGHHASLVLLNGCNENLWAARDWGWTEHNEGRSWGAAYYWTVLPDLVTELAPWVPYTPGSPFSPDQTDEHSGSHPNTASKGSMHVWDTWNAAPAIDYRKYRARFVAEFGWQGPPSWATAKRSCRDNPLTPESELFVGHQKAIGGMNKMHIGIEANFVVPASFNEWHWAASLTQARSVELGIAWYRSLFPENMGTVVWQLNDCWPTLSWAAIDSDGRPKPLLYALKHVHAPRLATIQPHEPVTSDNPEPADHAKRLTLLNDTSEPWATAIVVERTRFDGTVLASENHEVAVGAFGAESIPLTGPVNSPGTPGEEYLRVRVDGAADAWWFFVADRDSALQPADPKVSVVDNQVTITARESLLKDVALLVDRADAGARVDDMLVHLAPGESHTFTITSGLSWDENNVRVAIVTANDLIERS